MSSIVFVLYRVEKNNKDGLTLYLHPTLQIKDGKKEKFIFAKGNKIAGKKLGNHLCGLRCAWNASEAPAFFALPGWEYSVCPRSASDTNFTGASKQPFSTAFHSADCPYFLHWSHGSVSWTTDVGGDVISYSTFLPHGEPWVRDAVNPNVAPIKDGGMQYRFNGAEMEENGYYFEEGGSYYNPQLGISL